MSKKIINEVGCDYRDGWEVRNEYSKKGFDLLYCEADYNYVLINKKTFEIFGFCESDVYLTQCFNKNNFNIEIKKIFKFLKDYDIQLLKEAKYNLGGKL